MKKVNENQYLMNKLEFVKNPVIAEFLGYSLDYSFTETEPESSIINNLQKFLMELPLQDNYFLNHYPVTHYLFFYK